MYEKLQLAEQGRNAVAKELWLIKEESPAQPLTEGLVPLTDVPSKTTSSSSGRKAGRSFLDEFRSDLHAIVPLSDIIAEELLFNAINNPLHDFLDLIMLQISQ
jgi:hypothetical protein